MNPSKSQNKLVRTPDILYEIVFGISSSNANCIRWNERV